jgi:hypothetical protein
MPSKRPGLFHRRQKEQEENFEDDLDVEDLAREKTYVMLKRIDRLLEPSRAYFTSDLASSEQETASSSTPTTSCGFDQSLSDLDFDDDENDHVDKAGESVRHFKNDMKKDDCDNEDKENRSSSDDVNAVFSESLSLRARAQRRRALQSESSLQEHSEIPYNRAAVNLKNFYTKTQPARVARQEQRKFQSVENFSDYHQDISWRIYQIPDTSRVQSENLDPDLRKKSERGEEEFGHVSSGFRGHSEHPRVSPDSRYRQNLESMHMQRQAGNVYQGGGCVEHLALPTEEDPQHSRLNVFYPHEPSQRQTVTTYHLRTVLPPLQHHENTPRLIKVRQPIRGQADVDNSSDQFHSDNWVQGQGHSSRRSRRALVEERRRRSRVGDSGQGWLGGGVGGATLGEVIVRLEQKGVDLHKKCLEWINKSLPFFTSTSQTQT